MASGLRHYSGLLDELPPACVGVPTVLFALREGVVAALGGLTPRGDDGASEPLESTCEDLQDWYVKVMNDHAGADDEEEGLENVARTPINCPPVDAVDESLVRLTR